MSPEQEMFLSELFKAHAEDLVRYATSFLHDTDRSEEAVQEAFRVAVIHIDELMDHEAPEYWLKRTVKNKALKNEEARQRYIRQFFSLEDDNAVADTTADFTEKIVDKHSQSPISAMEKIRQSLTEDEFYILQRIVLEKATHKQVAQEMGITIWNSQQRLTRIRKKLYEVFPERKDKKKFKK